MNASSHAVLQAASPAAAHMLLRGALAATAVRIVTVTIKIKSNRFFKVNLQANSLLRKAGTSSTNTLCVFQDELSKLPFENYG